MGMKKVILRNKELLANIVLDSQRQYDVNNFMTVSNQVITSEQVAEYLGKEIPNYQSLGLIPTKIYKVYRPKDELIKSIDLWKNLPLLDTHIPVYADNLPKENVIGNIGSDVIFDDVSLRSSVTFWDKEAVNELESGKKGLSCGYGYTPVVESGYFNGIQYDIRMTDILPNHVAHVVNPRDGNAIVNDEDFKEREQMRAKDEANSENSLSDKMIDIFQTDLADAEKMKKCKALLASMSSAEDEDPEEDKDEAMKSKDKKAKDKKAKDKARDSEEDDMEDDCNDSAIATTSVKDGMGELVGKAMDADSIKGLITKYSQKAIREYNEARAICEPILKRVNIALDSPEALYNATLKEMGKSNLINASLETKRAVIEAIGSISMNSHQTILATDSNMVNMGEDAISSSGLKFFQSVN